MKTKFTLLLLCCALSLNIFAQERKIKDRRTNPDLYYLEESEVANSLNLLPPPPEAESILFLYDKARYDWGKLQRDTPRGDQAAQDARVDGNGVPFAFSEAFGVDITKEKLPKYISSLLICEKMPAIWLPAMQKNTICVSVRSASSTK